MQVGSENIADVEGREYIEEEEEEEEWEKIISL